MTEDEEATWLISYLLHDSAYTYATEGEGKGVPYPSGSGKSASPLAGTDERTDAPAGKRSVPGDPG